MATFLIVSPNGYGNVGDDICGYSGAYLARSLDPKALVVVTSPPFKEHLALAADVIILSGGGVLYDRDPANVENYMCYLDYAQKHGKKSAVLGVGVQGIVSDEGKARYREILNKTDLVTVRSAEDKAELDKIGVKNVVATQDLGFLADEWVKPPLFKPALGDSGKPRLGIGLADVRFLQAYKKGSQKLRDYIELMEANMARLAEDFDVYLFSHSLDDKTWREELARKHNLKIVKYKKIRHFAKLFYMYRHMDLVIGVRFHSTVLGILAKKPVVGIGSGQAKLFKLAQTAPTLLKQCVPLEDSAKLGQLLPNLRRDYDKGAFKVLPASEFDALKQQALSNRQLLAGVLKGIID